MDVLPPHHGKGVGLVLASNVGRGAVHLRGRAGGRGRTGRCAGGERSSSAARGAAMFCLLARLCCGMPTHRLVDAWLAGLADGRRGQHAQ